MKSTEILKVAATNYHCLKNRENWEAFAEQHNLPNYEETKRLFNFNWKIFKQRVYLSIAKKNIQYFYTPKYWDHYAEEKNLPKAKHYRALFDDWKQALSIVHNGLTPEEIKRDFLLNVAKKYKKQFENQNVWDTFALAHDLPIAATYKNHFENWNTVVEIVTGKRPTEKRYNKEMLLTVMAQHKEYLVTQESWKKYASEHHLPSVNTLAKHFGSFNIAKQSIDVQKIQKRVFSKEELVEVAEKYRDVFHLSLWNFYASTYQLPSETAFNNHFSHFKTLQKELGIQEGEYTEQTHILMNQAITEKEQVLTTLTQENEELIQQLAPHWQHFESKQTWKVFTDKHKYPSYLDLLAIFSSKRQLKQVLFLYMALQHKEQFNNKEWNQYASIHGLPHKMNYYNLFSSWDSVQQMVWGNSKEAKKMYLLRIALEHIEEFTTYNNWKEYASKHNLPSASQFEFTFGGWNEVKKVLGLKQNRLLVGTV